MNRHNLKLSIGAAVVSVLILGPTFAYAVILGSGPPGSGLTADWFGVGMVGLAVDGADDFFCTGTLITNRHVLTAGHCVTQTVPGFPTPREIPFPASSMRFAVQLPLVGVSTYSSVAVIPHPQWNGIDGGNDIAIIRLDRTIPNAAPFEPWVFNDGMVDEATPGLVAHAVGFGIGGDGFDGEDRLNFPYGEKRTGTNAIDLVNGPNTVFLPSGFRILPHTLTIDFDNPDNPEPNVLGGGALLSTEATITHGDSGGPTFQFDFATERFVVVGVHSYGCVPRDPLNPQPEIDCIAGITNFGQFGEVNVDTRVSIYSPWIRGVIAVTPEPGSLATLTIGLTLVVLTRRQRHSKSAVADRSLQPCAVGCGHELTSGRDRVVTWTLLPRMVRCPSRRQLTVLLKRLEFLANDSHVHARTGDRR